MFYFLRLACAFQLRICILLAWESLFLHEIIVRDAVETTCFLLQVLVVVFLACFRIVILVSSFFCSFSWLWRFGLLRFSCSIQLSQFLFLT